MNELDFEAIKKETHLFYSFLKGILTDERAQEMGWNSWQEMYDGVIKWLDKPEEVYHLQDLEVRFPNDLVKTLKPGLVRTYTFHSDMPYTEGGEDFGYRIFEREAPVLIDEQGRPWFDAEDEKLYADIFC